MTEQTPDSTNKKSKWLPWIGAVIIIGVPAVLWIPLSQIGTDTAALRRWIEQLGPLAPVAFFLLNVAQIVVAPIPGYPVQVLGGILFGFVPGSIYAVAGMVAGGTLAAWLGRKLGRPWLKKRVGTDTLNHWSEMIHIDSFWAWWIILLIPLGDVPYFVAGLSRIRLSVFAPAILASRGPFTVLIVWMGDSVVNLPLTWIAAMMAVVGIIVIVGLSQAQRIELWARKFVARQASNRADS